MRLEFDGFLGWFWSLQQVVQVSPMAELGDFKELGLVGW